MHRDSPRSILRRDRRRLPWGLLLCAALTAPASAQGTDTTRVSVSSSGAEGNYRSQDPRVSGDGRWVVFQSFARTLDPNDTNLFDDVYVHDRQTATTAIVSVNLAGFGAGGNSITPDLSDDGTAVAFHSDAGDLVASDTNGWADIFVRDLVAGVTTLASVDSAGNSADLWSQPYPALSGDGTVVAFASAATNLVAGDGNGKDDVFVRDLVAGTTTRVSVSSAGAEANQPSQTPDLSGDGNLVAFASMASNLVPTDSNGFVYDIFVHDRAAGTTTLVSVDSSGAQGASDSLRPTLSLDGRFVAFETGSPLIKGDKNATLDVYVHDRQTGSTILASRSDAGALGNDMSLSSAISGNGRFVTFTSFATNLVSGDTNGAFDVFLRDTWKRTTLRVSVASDGTEGDGWSPWLGFPAVSGDGRVVVFDSSSTNLVAGDSNGMPDVFASDTRPWQGYWVDLGYGLAGVNGVPVLEGTGTLVAGSPGQLDLFQAAPTASTWVLVSFSSNPTPFKGGTLVPVPIDSMKRFLTDAGGRLTLPWASWPGGLSGLSLYFQCVVADGAAVRGMSLSNALRADNQ